MLVWTQPIYGIQERPKERPAPFRFADLDRRAWLVLGFAPVLCLTLYGIFALHLFNAQVPLFSLFCLLTLTLLSKQCVIRVVSTDFDIANVVILASFVVLGPFWTLANVFVASLSYAFLSWNKLKLWAHLFNMEMFLVAGAGIPGLLYGIVSPISVLGALILAGVALFFLNYLLVTIYEAVVVQKSIRDAWRENAFLFNAGLSLIYISLGYLMGRLFLVSHFYLLLFFSPFVMFYYASRSFYDVKQEMGTAIQIFGDLLARRDEYTYEHTLRVAQYSRLIGMEMGLKQDVIDECIRVARLHDIGKIAVPDHILRKEGALTHEEYHHVQEHVRLIPELFPQMDRFGKILRLVMFHHEKYDGSGYPYGLKGSEIPIEARVVAVADAWDAMTTSRVYRRRLSEEKALQILRDYSGSQFDPVAVEAFLRAHGKGECRPPSEAAA